MKRASGMRVLMTADAVGGVWTYAVTLCRGLAAAGCDVELVTLGPRPSDTQRAALDGCSVSLIDTDLALEWQDPAGRDRGRAAHELARIASGFGPDVIHFNSYREASYGWSTPTLVVAHSCVRSWAEACDEMDMMQMPAWQSYAEAVREGLCASSVWVSPTSFFRDEIVRLYGVASGRVIRNGSDVTAASASSKRPIILSAGRVWDVAKNMQALFAAAPGLVWPLAIAGEIGGPDQRETLSRANPEVRLLGALPHSETLAWMHQAAMFVSSAQYEPFGLGVLEAARFGCALILSDIGTFRELWSGAALFVSNDAAELADRLNQVSRDGNLRRCLQESARRRAQRYSASAMTTAYLALYRTLSTREVIPAVERVTTPQLEGRA